MFSKTWLQWKCSWKPKMHISWSYINYVAFLCCSSMQVIMKMTKDNIIVGGDYKSNTNLCTFAFISINVPLRKTVQLKIFRWIFHHPNIVKNIIAFDLWNVVDDRFVCRVFWVYWDSQNFNLCCCQLIFRHINACCSQAITKLYGLFRTSQNLNTSSLNVCSKLSLYLPLSTTRCPCYNKEAPSPQGKQKYMTL